MKVLFLVPSLGMGGMERVLVNYANMFAARGYDVTVKNFSFDDVAIVSHFNEAVHYEKQYTPVKNLLHAGIRGIFTGNFRILPWSMWLEFHSAKYLYKKYVKENYDVEIAFFGSESIKIISGSTNQKAVKIGWIHSVNLEDDIPPLGTCAKAKRVYSQIEKLICVSEQSRDKVREVLGRTEKVYIVNNPNDSSAIKILAKEKGTPEKKKFTFVTVSRIVDEHKGFFRLLDVCKKLNDIGLMYDLWIVGDGKDYSAVKNKAEECGLSNIRFLGQQSNPYKYIDAADMYLCASYFEGFSMVMMEAVILAKPQIATDVSGARDMLGDSEYGLIVENSEEGLYNGMKRILSDKALYEHYIKKAQERKDYLSKDVIMDKVERIINGEF